MSIDLIVESYGGIRKDGMANVYCFSSPRGCSSALSKLRDIDFKRFDGAGCHLIDFEPGKTYGTPKQPESVVMPTNRLSDGYFDAIS